MTVGMISAIPEEYSKIECIASFGYLA